ncbi:hypothetical protein IW261DRAFT_477925 [Armillaria novae-zelandiae]|uniref:F-box domain-containing protein n=1 Tax=Armillaria novae-zelandiae TaxID=153914 RepID=A0AA39U6L4_9AGAR|nr:hypothetical protein IW261DRAFT_477925 [Armillaria novae-zelandiae]
MTETPLNWSPCTGCTCSNHSLPSFDFPPDRHTLSPNLAGLTSSNDTPSETEEATLREAIVSCEAKIREIDTEEAQLTQFVADMQSYISLAEKNANTLRQERRAISDAVTERKHLLNPVRRLPTEILLRIFRLTIVFPIPRSNSVEGDEEGWNFYPPENTLCKIEGVCKQWYEVVLSFPELWPFPNISITDRNFGDDAQGMVYAHRLGLQLDRSRNQLLSLSIWNDVVHSSFTKLPAVITAILSTISFRVESLHLYLPVEMFADIPSFLLCLPSLTELCLHPTDPGAIDVYRGIDLFVCPNLRLLHVVDVMMPLRSFHLPWTQISTFTSDSGYYQQQSCSISPLSALQIMRRSLVLEECHMRFEVEEFEEQWTGEVFPVVCPSLRTLSLASWGFEDHLPLKQLAERIKLPVLSNLRVACRESYYGRESIETFTAICGLIERSGPPQITTLYFNHGCVLEDDVLRVLRMCPSLEDIRLTDVDEGAVGDQALLLLTLGVDGVVPVVPRLHTFHLSGNTSFSMQTFVDMVESRWILADVQSPPARRLGEVNLCQFLRAEDEADEDKVERISVLSALDVYKVQGLNISRSGRQLFVEVLISLCHVVLHHCRTRNCYTIEKVSVQ